MRYKGRQGCRCVPGGYRGSDRSVLGLSYQRVLSQSQDFLNKSRSLVEGGATPSLMPLAESPALHCPGTCRPRACGCCGCRTAARCGLAGCCAWWPTRRSSRATLREVRWRSTACTACSALFSAVQRSAGQCTWRSQQGMATLSFQSLGRVVATQRPSFPCIRLLLKAVNQANKSACCASVKGAASSYTSQWNRGVCCFGARRRLRRARAGGACAGARAARVHAAAGLGEPAGGAGGHHGHAGGAGRAGEPTPAQRTTAQHSTA